jgi:hypothetical protein
MGGSKVCFSEKESLRTISLFRLIVVVVVRVWKKVRARSREAPLLVFFFCEEEKEKKSALLPTFSDTLKQF